VALWSFIISLIRWFDYTKTNLYHCFPYITFKMNLQVEIEPLDANKSKSVATETAQKTTGMWVRWINCFSFLWKNIWQLVFHLVREFFCQSKVRKFWKVIGVCGMVKPTVCSCLIVSLEWFYSLFSLKLYFMLQKQYQLRFTEWLVVLINIKSYIKAINKMIRERVQSLQTCLLLHLKTKKSCQIKRFVAIL